MTTPGDHLTTRSTDWKPLRKTLEARKDTKPNVKALEVRLVQEIERYRNPENRILYSALFYPLLVIVAAGLNLISIFYARRALEELSQARSLLSLFSLGLSAILISPLFSLFAFSLLYVIASPVSWFAVWGLVALGRYVSWILALTLTLPAAVIVSFIGAQWIRILVSIIVLPCILVVVISLGAVIVFPLRRVIRSVLIAFLSRALASERGFLSCCALIFSACGAVAIEITRALTGHFPF